MFSTWLNFATVMISALRYFGVGARGRAIGWSRLLRSSTDAMYGWMEMSYRTYRCNLSRERNSSYINSQFDMMDQDRSRN
ncbi:hypothetical protein C8R43DRAFT_1016184 [Mycena crocata]|nr:hypothetical protein C8R43DRAFT_1016184 [Mycena crocata]